MDRDKALKQGVDARTFIRRCRPSWAGYLVNYFNRFGRQWQVYVEAEGDYRTQPKISASFTSATGGDGAADRL